MKTKSIIKYYFYEIKSSIFIFYLVMLVGCVANYIGYKLTDGKLNSTGVEIATNIFVFVMGLNLFKSQFHFLIQNGVTRKANFIGILAITLMSVMFAVIDTFIGAIMYNLVGYESIYNLLYVNPEHGFMLLDIVKSILFLTTTYSVLFMLGYFITTAYYAMNKTLKIVVSVSVPVFIIIVIPALDYYLNLGIGELVNFIILNILGIYNSSIGNVLHPIVSCVIIYIIISALTYLEMRRIPVKE